MYPRTFRPRPVTQPMSTHFSSMSVRGQPYRQPATRVANTKIIIKNLDRTVTESHLNFLLVKYGQVRSCKVARDHQANPKGYAIVCFADHLAAERAINHMNGMTYCGKQLVVESCRNTPADHRVVHNTPGLTSNLYVKNLSDRFDSEDKLRDLFATFGPISSVKLVDNTRGQSDASKRFGYVNFFNEDSAQMAIDSLNGRVIDGLSLVVEKYVDRSDRRNPAYFTSLYIKYLPLYYDSDAKLRMLFAPFGDVVSAKVATDTNGQPLNYGFVSMANPGMADKACEELNGKRIGGGSVLLVNRMVNKQEKIRRLKFSDKTGISRIFIRNLHPFVTNQDLIRTFARFGSILSSKVIQSNPSLGYGYVVFLTGDSAKTAINEANGLVLNGQTIIVEKYIPPNMRKPKSEPKPEQLNAVYVKNFIDDIYSDEQLRELFAPFGTITSAKVHVNQFGQSKGFGFVGFADQMMADRAIKQLNGLPLVSGKELYVSRAMTKDQRLAQLKASETHDCEICFEATTGDNVVDCGCEHKFCADCVANYLSSLISEGLISSITCPESDCNQSADESLIKKLVSDDLFDRYERLMLKEITKDMDDIINCPNPACDALVEAEIHILRAECHQCNKVYCTNCLKEYHELTDCELTPQQRQYHAQLSETYVDRAFKRCPACRTPIEKNEGCNHMTCSQCRQQFCWICLSDWSGRHYNCVATAAAPTA